MSQSPFEHAGGLRIGTVEFVSPDEIKVGLDIEAPESIALNAGGPRPFPRVNGYLMVPVDDGFLVGQIEWMTVERSPFPKRRNSPAAPWLKGRRRARSRLPRPVPAKPPPKVFRR